jgi:vacuolar-type H+-ATPase subunit I/STV1
MSRKSKQVIAVTPAGDITMDHIIGFYALFAVPDKAVSAAKLHRLWIAEGLPPELVPNARESKHAFMAACRSIQTKKRNEGGAAELKGEIKSDLVVETEGEMVYQVTHLVRDLNNEVIDHPKTMRVRFDKWNEYIEWEPLNKRFKPELIDELGRAIENHFNENQTKLPGPRVRSAVRGLMEELGGTNVRRKAGGVYFIPKEGRNDLDALGRVFAALYEPDEAELHLIPCANADGEREMVERHFNVNVTTEIDELMAEVTDALNASDSDRRLRKDRVNNILQRRKQIADHRTRYQALLDTELEEVGEKADLLDRQLTELITKYGGD